MSGESAFFYGTLCHPTILQRVIGNSGAHLTARPAVLLDYTRHHVKHKDADYPAIIPYARTRELVPGELGPEDRSVRGTLVAGLTAEDIRLLDVFEGNEYARERVRVHPLGAPAPLAAAPRADLVPAAPPPLPPRAELPEAAEASTYVWTNPLAELRPEPWSFEQFVRDNAWKWVGDGAHANEDFEKVDGARWAGRRDAA